MEKSHNRTSKLIVLSKKKLYTVLKTLRIMTKTFTVLALFLYALSHCKVTLSFHKSQSVKPAAPPTRFFPSNSVVVDFPYGQIQPIVTLLQEEELIFLMYYAPWCAECLNVRDEFMKAARVFHETIKFVAVNCWYTEGECRKTMKIFSFPELYVYHVGIDEGYRFTGPKKAEMFVRFVESFLNPLHPLYSEREVQEFIAKQDNTVIGYFDFNSSPQPPGSAFYQFYLAALRVISHDFYQPIRFGIILVKRLAEYFDMKSPERFVMARTGNITLKYPLFYNMTSRNITNWIYHFRQQNAARWLVPPGVKSLTLSLALKQGPAVILLAPSNPMFEYNPYLDIVHLLSLQYNSCGNFSNQMKNIARMGVIQSLLQLNRLRQITEKCRTVTPRCLNNKSKCCVSFLTGAKSLNSVCEYCVQKNNVDSDTVCDMEWESMKRSELYSAQLNTCIHSSQSYNINEHYSVSCRQDKSSAFDSLVFKSDGKKLRRQTDPFVINGVHRAFKLQCNKFSMLKMKKLLHYENFTNIITKFSDLSKNAFILGQSCDTNQTLRFYFMDSTYNSMITERLGISVKSLPNRATVILVDLKEEATYHLREDVNYASLAQFVSNYTEGKLNRVQRSVEISSPSVCDPRSSSVCVVDVSMETFSTVVLDNNKDVVLLYYTPWCGFCSHFAHTFLAAAKYFGPYRNISFARIDAETNDLPWEFTVDRYPTVILFPAQRKADSIKFPDNIPKSLPNLIKFILYHSKHQLQLEAAVNLCSKDCVERNKKLALQITDKLHTFLRHLHRKIVTLSEYVDPEKKYFFIVRATIRQVYDVRREKLRKAQQLSYFLDTDLKSFTKRVT